jgi:hypothetical protein
MFGPSVRIALVVIGVVAALIIVTAGSASSATQKQCSAAYNRCMDGCDKLGKGPDGSPYAKCTGKCGLALINCTPWSLPKSSGALQTPTGTTQPPPKGKGGLNPVDVGGIKEPGGGSTSPPKGKGGLGQVNVGGIKNVGEGISSGTGMIQRSHSRGKQ